MPDTGGRGRGCLHGAHASRGGGEMPRSVWPSAPSHPQRAHPILPQGRRPVPGPCPRARPSACTWPQGTDTTAGLGAPAVTTETGTSAASCGSSSPCSRSGVTLAAATFRGPALGRTEGQGTPAPPGLCHTHTHARLAEGRGLSLAAAPRPAGHLESGNPGGDVRPS